MTRRSLVVCLPAMFTSSQPIQWLTLDLGNQNVRDRWPERDRAVSVGSLLKPFLMVAYGATHASFPVIRCQGAGAGCWSARGHGEQTVENALANSCNVYFRQLAASLDRAALDQTCLAYGLRSPSRVLTAPELIGLGAGWPQAPSKVATAFARLAANRHVAGVRLAFAGMARCAAGGTAGSVGMKCYAKTGTAPCSHVPKAQGDGYAVALFPQDEPRHLILVQHHNTTGAQTARDIRPLLASRNLT